MSQEAVKSCCFVADRCVLIGIIATTLLVVGFSLSVYKLIVSSGCIETTPYYMLLSNILSMAAGAVFSAYQLKRNREE